MALRTPEEEHRHDMQDPEYAQWFNSRPQVVQDLIRQYPYTKYRVKEGAPYGVSCPGTIVYLGSYGESGEVGVLVKFENKLKECFEHERRLCELYNKNLHEMHRKDVIVHIDPQWLEPIE